MKAVKRTLQDLGWNEAFAEEFLPHAAQGWVPARLIRDNKTSLGALILKGTRFEELDVVTSGKVYHDAEDDAALPAVGDWVALDLGSKGQDHVIRARLSRQTCLSRKAPGNSTQEQVIVANVSTVFVVTEPGADFNLRRMERYLEVIQHSHAQAVVLLNKSDLYSKADCQEAAEEIQQLCTTAHAHIISVEERRGLKVLSDYLRPGQTVAIIGSSGVGKSALVNYLLGGEYQETGEVNEKTDKGRHTTTARELMVLRKGGIIVDNPGIKEVQMWTDEGILRQRFADISSLAAACLYHDCKHASDHGCAIKAAVKSGTLEPARYDSFLRLEQEVLALRDNMKKRQMILERVHKRKQSAVLRNQADRKALRRELKPDWERETDWE
jgi:ribosome biogenesis GTPase / thiamine phosphate phosphatase